MQKTTNSAENIASFLDALETPSKPLTKWELDFLISISDQFERTRSLSERQFEVLEKIYAEKTA